MSHFEHSGWLMCIFMPTLSCQQGEDRIHKHRIQKQEIVVSMNLCVGERRKDAECTLTNLPKRAPIPDSILPLPPPRFSGIVKKA